MSEKLMAAACRIAEKANDCCCRSDGYEEAIQSLALGELQSAYAQGRFDQRIEDEQATHTAAGHRS